MKRARGASAMKPRMALGDFLVAYLKRAGVTHVFGLPGDLVLGLFHRFGRERGLEIVTFSHEPAVGFAADGYARSTRRLGVAVVTYGAGGNNIVNAVAGAYAEQVGLLVVSGGPGEAEQRLSGVHHQVKDVAGQFRILSRGDVRARASSSTRRSRRRRSTRWSAGSCRSTGRAIWKFTATASTSRSACPTRSSRGTAASRARVGRAQAPRSRGRDAWRACAARSGRS